MDRGKLLWQSLNEYHELTENTRFTNLTESILANFNFHARTGNPNHRLLDELNATRGFTTLKRVYQEIDTRTKDQILMTTSLASTNSLCNELNKYVNKC
jgi:hypothetical protein